MTKKDSVVNAALIAGAVAQITGASFVHGATVIRIGSS